MLDKGFSKLSSKTFLLGKLSGTLRSASISSEKHKREDLISGSKTLKANCTIEVLATSPKVPT